MMTTALEQPYLLQSQLKLQLKLQLKYPSLV
jgi:hypothetical protein